MYNARLGINVIEKFGLSLEQEIDLIYKSGFDGIFTHFTPQKVTEARKLCNERGLVYQSVHAPYFKNHKMWTKDEYKEPLEQLIACAESCSENCVPLMVTHAFIGFNDHAPNEYGVENFAKAAERAKELGVNVAIENTEGMEYLEKLMCGLSHMKNVGFCYDTGHEQCYNWGKNMLALYGDKLFCTHLHDNAGIRDFDGKINICDDLHLMPYDGIIDWDATVMRIAQCCFDGPLTLELKVDSIEGRYENHMYKTMTPEEYYAKAYLKACKVGTAFVKAKQCVSKQDLAK